jgi:hypothetical protein
LSDITESDQSEEIEKKRSFGEVNMEGKNKKYH